MPARAYSAGASQKNTGRRYWELAMTVEEMKTMVNPRDTRARVLARRA